MKQAADECGYNTVDRKEFDPSHKESAFDGLYHILVDMKAVKVGDAVEYTSDSDEEAAEGAFMVEGTVLTLHPIDAALPDWHAAFTVDRPWIGFPDKRRYLDYREFARRIPSHTLIGEGIKALSLYASREDTSAELRELLQDICQHYGVATTPQPGTYPSTPEHRKSIALLHQYLTDPDAKTASGASPGFRALRWTTPPATSSIHRMECLSSMGWATEPTLTLKPPSILAMTGTCFSLAASVVFSTRRCMELPQHASEPTPGRTTSTCWPQSWQRNI